MDYFENQFEEESIYWERQDSDLLCAVHALNSLIQFPCWDPVSLAQLARDIDDEENSLFNDRQKLSQNVQESGFYSVQVITRALQTKNLSMNYFNKSEDPTKYNGFICNFQMHWLSLRKIKKNWYNLNSLAESPEWIGEIYLSALLDQIISDNYTIFVVTGEFPLPNYYEYYLQPHQCLVPVSVIRPSKSTNLKNQEEDEIRQAIALSLNAEDDDLSLALALSLQHDN